MGEGETVGSVWEWEGEGLCVCVWGVTMWEWEAWSVK